MLDPMKNRRKLIKNYFNTKLPKYPWILILIGLAGTFFLTFSFVLTLVGAGILYFSKKDRPTDNEYDTWLDTDLQKFYSEAMKKTRLDQADIVRDPVMMIGPKWRDLGGAEIFRRKGKDKKIRHSPLSVTIINFTEHQLVTYQTSFDFTTGKALNTGTKRFFYTDVVSAETRSENLTIDKKNINAQLYKDFPEVKDHIVNDKLQLHQAETFALTTKGGTTLEVILNEPDFLGEVGSSDFTDRITDQAINAVNKMLLTKKTNS